MTAAARLVIGPLSLWPAAPVLVVVFGVACVGIVFFGAGLLRGKK